VEASDKLSPHFTLGELTRSSTALRMGIDNTPDDKEISRLKTLCAKILEPVRLKYGPFSPSSGFRSTELNRQIGSRDTSQHVKGEAVDFEIVGTPNAGLAAWIAGNLKFDQLILEFYTPDEPNSGWIHVSFAEKNRQQVLTINKDGVFPGILGDD